MGFGENHVDSSKQKGNTPDTVSRWSDEASKRAQPGDTLKELSVARRLTTGEWGGVFGDGAKQPTGYGSKREALGTTGFGLLFMLPIGFFRYLFLTQSRMYVVFSKGSRLGSLFGDGRTLTDLCLFQRF